MVTNTASNGAAAGVLVVLLVVLLVPAILVIAGTWKVFVKAGQPGWAAIIPGYNVYVMNKVGGGPTYYFWVWLGCAVTPFLFVTPFVGLVFAILILNNLAKSFGKDPGYTVGLVLLGVIFFPVLGFGSSQYVGPVPRPSTTAAGGEWEVSIRAGQVPEPPQPPQGT